MKKIVHITTVLLMTLALSCSEYHVDTILEKSDPIKQIKKAGLILRISKNSRISREEFNRNLTHWLASRKPRKNINILAELKNKVGEFVTEEDRFYQLSAKGDFLEYKAQGVVNMYLRENQAELKNLMKENGLDGFILYEVYGVVSTEMQFMDFDSVMVLVDTNLSVVYLDHQTDKFESNEYDYEKIKSFLLNKVSERFMYQMADLKFLEK